MTKHIMTTRTKATKTTVPSRKSSKAHKSSWSMALGELIPGPFPEAPSSKQATSSQKSTVVKTTATPKKAPAGKKVSVKKITTPKRPTGIKKTPTKKTPAPKQLESVGWPNGCGTPRIPTSRESTSDEKASPIKKTPTKKTPAPKKPTGIKKTPTKKTSTPKKPSPDKRAQYIASLPMPPKGYIYDPADLPGKHAYTHASDLDRRQRLKKDTDSNGRTSAYWTSIFTSPPSAEQSWKTFTTRYELDAAGYPIGLEQDELEARWWYLQFMALWRQAGRKLGANDRFGPL